jgi:hypothetical protein
MVQVGPEVVGDLLKPSGAGEFIEADLFLTVDVHLLNLDPVMTEAASM